MRRLSLALAAGLGLVSSPVLACSSCGCNLTSDWLSQGLVAQPGTTLGLRYDFVPQTRLRADNAAVDRGTITFPAEREIEQASFNHYLTASIDHAFSPEWAINVQMPFVVRPHRTVAEGDVDQSYSRSQGLGDARVSLRFQGFGGPGITGVQLGLKLPTGRIGQAFLSGPQAGMPVDRGLQTGTGALDATLGAYHFGRLGGSFDYLVQALGEVPLTTRSDFTPGAAATLSAGINYTGWRGITPQLQLNLRLAAKDRGLYSDRDNSGGEQLYAAPGVSVQVSGHVSAFGIVQLPLYQRVNGYQLTPRYTLSFGLLYRI